MGWDYALVHLKYTIPPSLALTFIYWPLLARLDVYKICFLVIIAVISTIPWDSYLIRTRIWTYPPDSVFGPVLFDIPIEELFFFFIQTYGVSLLYLCVSRPTLHAAHLPTSRASDGILARYTSTLGVIGQAFLAYGIYYGSQLIRNNGSGTYMGLIIVWAFPFIFLLWSLTHPFLLQLPISNTLGVIVIPTLYLWLVDTFALRRGTWVIMPDTKLGIHLWDGLEIEEAFFFLVTNILVVSGLIAIDNSLAIINTFPELFPNAPELPSPYLAFTSLLLPTNEYDSSRIMGLRQAVSRLERKSRSFFLASATFQGKLRADLISLYSFCRVADDLVDTASSPYEADQWIEKLHDFLDRTYKPIQNDSNKARSHFVHTAFPKNSILSLLHLPVKYLSSRPLYDLLDGFDMDLEFSLEDETGALRWPIKDESDLMKYAYSVAGTVAELVIECALHHYPLKAGIANESKIRSAGALMGQALQIVNISRDMQVDALMGRVYIPLDWLEDMSMTPEEVLEDPTNPALVKLRSRLLDLAFALYEESRGAIEMLPIEARGPMRVAVESYMEIGRVLREEGFQVKNGKATVPRFRRIFVALKALWNL